MRADLSGRYGKYKVLAAWEEQPQNFELLHWPDR